MSSQKESKRQVNFFNLFPLVFKLTLELLQSKTKATLGTGIQFILDREPWEDLTGLKAQNSWSLSFSNQRAPASIPQCCACFWSKVGEQKRQPPYPLGRSSSSFSSLVVTPLWRKLANCFFLLQYFNQYFWSSSKYGLLSSIWCNWWPAHRARTSLPLCPASRCTSRGNREGKKWFVVNSQEFGKP